MTVRDVEIMPAETAIRWVEFHPHPIFKHLDQSMVVTNKRVVVRVPRTIFSVFVLGYYERSVTWDNVDTVVSGRGVDSKRLFIGSLVSLLALFGLLSGGRMLLMWSTAIGYTQVLLSLVLGVIGILVLLSAFARVVGVITSSGQALLVGAAASEVSEMVDLASLLKVSGTQRTEPTSAPTSNKKTGVAR